MKKHQKIRGWTQDEDKIIADLVKSYGTKAWAQISTELFEVYGYKKKSGKQCRQRWHNHLNPSINKRGWTQDEEYIMFEKHKIHGNKWTLISQALPGRTDNSIKNHFYSTLRRCFRRMNKIIGSKNSTQKMKIVKPSALSLVFSFAEGTENPLLKKSIQEGELSQINLKDLSLKILNFSQTKIKKKKEQVTIEEIYQYIQIIENIQQINDIYEKIIRRRSIEKKESLLAKKFDDFISSQQVQQQSVRSDDYNLVLSEVKKQTTREQVFTKSLNQINQQGNQVLEMKENDVYVKIQQQKEWNQLLKKQQKQENDLQNFSLDLPEQPINFDQLKYSPGFHFVSPVVTPTQGIILFDASNQVMKVNQFNDQLEKLRETILNSVQRKANRINNLPPSPISAFKRFL